ncbi:MAG: permease [Candidatus Eremiobacteraeota bacterium]|nr:permease [Candidatus Eremiobacteraeota bacterium]MBV9648157.1 permease [Candidatus Eremiobacteraeota bacterium]
MEAVGLHAGLFGGVRATLELLWDSLFGLIFGFLISAVAQVTFNRVALAKVFGTGLYGVIRGAAFGIVASACSYGAVAAARGLYAKGADLRAVLSFLISSTNMNVAILILFWALLGWKFALAEFVGGLIIIAIVTGGFTLLFREWRAMRHESIGEPALVEQCLQCGMEGERDHAVAYERTTYLFCGSAHERAFRIDPAAVLGNEGRTLDVRESFAALRRSTVWRRILTTAWGDVLMLRWELTIGFVVAGFAAALVPARWLSGALHAVGAVPFVGYVLLLLVGLLLAVLTFVCSMGNVPIARYLAMAGIPLGANTTFIYGDLLVPPLIAIYRKTFPPAVVWAFLGLFVLGALVAGAAMDALIGGVLGGVAMGSMVLSDRVTLISNVVAIVALGAVTVYAYAGTKRSLPQAESITAE